MTEQEKRMVMQFMGQTYGEMKKQDDMLVSSSGSLRPKSDEMKKAFTEMARQPTAHQQQPPQPPQPAPDTKLEPAPPEPAPVSAPVSFEQAVQELRQVESTNVEIASDPNQLEFDLKEPSKLDELLEATKSTNLLLKDIKLLLEKKNGKPTRKKATGKKPG